KIVAISRRKPHLYECRRHRPHLTNDRDLVSQKQPEREYAEVNRHLIYPDHDPGCRCGNGYIDDKRFRAGAVRTLPAGPWLHSHESGKLQRVLSARPEARMEGVRQP